MYSVSQTMLAIEADTLMIYEHAEAAISALRLNRQNTGQSSRIVSRSEVFPIITATISISDFIVGI